MSKHTIQNICSICSKQKDSFDMIQLFDQNGICTLICTQKCWTKFSLQSQCQPKKLLEEKFREFLYTCVPPLPFGSDVSTQTEFNGNKENCEQQQRQTDCLMKRNDNKKRLKTANANNDGRNKGDALDDVGSGTGIRRPLTVNSNSLKRPFRCIDQSDDQPLKLCLNKQ